MNYKLKNILQQTFSQLPNGEKVNFLFQRYVTRKLPCSEEVFLGKVDMALKHHNNFEQYKGTDAQSNKYYEFGAGWDLIIPITMALLNYEVHCIDIRTLIKPDLIEDTINKFITLRDKIPFEYRELTAKKLDRNNSLNVLQRDFNITYKAPSDARNTSLPPDSIDFISSTATFEHIPPADLALILKECQRILKKGGILSLDIDYRDHWAYADSALSVYHFLQFSDKAWQKYNPDLHYQNRLRHSDYLRLIEKTDLKIVMDRPEQGNASEMEQLKQIELNGKYKAYDLNDLSIKGAMIVLRK